MNEQPFNNPSSQAEKREMLRQSTYLDQAKADADLAAGGRFEERDRDKSNWNSNVSAATTQFAIPSRSCA